jgi:hypothetical protein
MYVVKTKGFLVPIATATEAKQFKEHNRSFLDLAMLNVLIDLHKSRYSHSVIPKITRYMILKNFHLDLIGMEET